MILRTATCGDAGVVQRSRRHDDRGSGTIWAVAMIGLVWSAGTVAIAVGGVRAARHRVYAAADMAALAAAANAAGGPQYACGLAARVARASGGQLRRCVVRARRSQVTVTSAVRLGYPFGSLVVIGRARAGPGGPGDPAGPEGGPGDQADQARRAVLGAWPFGRFGESGR